MENLLIFPTNAIATAVAFLIFVCSVFCITRSMKKKKAAPEAGGAWPLIGHLHLLRGPQPSHIVFGNMADKYGPIFTIKMGVHPTLVASNWEMAKECFTTNDKAFANRPNILAMDLLGYGRSMFAFSPYGNYWRQIRKISTLELLSNHRLQMFNHVRESEVGTALKELYKLWEKNKTTNSNNKVLVEMKRWFGDITLNIILRIIVGKFIGYETADEGKESNEGWKQALRDFFHLSGRFIAADAVPFLRWLDIGGHEKTMKHTANKLDIVVTEWLNEHKEKKASGCVKKGEEDFMDLILDIMDDEAEATLSRDSDTINKATCLALTLAASDTTSVTLIWALSLLVNNPDVLKKAQDELDVQVGRERQVHESDVNNLIFLKAIVKETLRLYPAGPLSVPHESMKDCTVAGYHIPAGTRLVTNLSKIHRDPRVWSNPSEYQQERFLTSHQDFDVRGKTFEFIPFGSGRRMCPGVSFALQVLHITLATLLHGFNFGTPTGEPLDMTENFGLTNLRATPLEVAINPRLGPHLYE
ncbi:cytochrome P450, putative [Ricinus communis]|uniref:Cytochrome P450, putative n=1 Tax=Ricinus communis TaxID=3988 RepID=B9R7M0_RICCO|nr:cytochrome P450, putative [Ricinus communis]|eukprot:XP_002510313.1 cytochrome P450 CYP82D47 [Ricinus communis]